MTIRSLRVPEDIEQAIEYVSHRENIDKSQSLRKLARLGFEVYVAAAYRQGRLTLREASSLLGITLQETLELLGELGVPGNVRAADVLASLESARALSGNR